MYYRLIGRLAVPCDNVDEFARRHADISSRVVDQTTVGELFVSTVFLMIDHCWGEGDPILFETMILGDCEHSYQTRCSTWDEAERMHAVALVVAADWVTRATQLTNTALCQEESDGSEDH